MAISDKLTYLSETKSQLKTMINYGLETPLTNEPFRDYVSSLFEAYIESLNNPNTLWGNLPKIKSTGANLFNPNWFTYRENNGITATLENDHILLNGTATATAYFNFAIPVSMGNSANLYWFTKCDEQFGGMQVQRTGQSVTNITPSTSWNRQTIGNSETYTYSGYIYVSNGTTLNNCKLYIDVRKDDILVSNFVYEPYTGGSTSTFSLNNTIEAPMKLELNPVELEQRNLPSEYTEVEYIQSSGTQYINTGVTPKSGIGIDITAEVVTENNTDKILIGSRANTGNTRFWIDFDGTNAGDNNQKIISGYGNFTLTPVIYSLNTKYNILFNYNDNSKIIINDTEYNITTTPDYTDAIPMYIFKANYTTSFAGSFKLYYCKIYDGTTLIRDYIPCYRNSDNIIGLYDLVNNVFYTNAGSGTFLKGNDALPTPSNPQTIHTISGDNEIKIENNNLFDKVNATLNNSYYTLNNDGTITTNITYGSDGRRYLNAIALKAGTYTLSFIPSLSTGDAIRLSIINSDTSANIYNDTRSITNGTMLSQTFTLNENTNVSLCIEGHNATYKPLTISNIMLNKGSTPTSYIEHKEQVKEINLGDIEYCEIGDYADKFVKCELPKEYTQVDYIESSGTQYINTGYKYNANDEIEIEFMQLITPVDARIFGAYDSSSAYCLFGVINGKLRGNANETNAITYSTDTKYKCNLSGGQWYYNGNAFGAAKNNSVDRVCYLFDGNFGYSTSPTTARIYSLKVTRSNAAIRNLIPCYRNSDNEVGLYDLINNVFYTNQGTGSFTYGSAISTDNGQWYIKKNIGKVVLDGSEDEGWELYNSTSTRTAAYITVNNIKDYTINDAAYPPKLLSSHFISISQNAAWLPGNISMRYQDNERVYFCFDSSYTDTNSIKNWFSNNNTTLYYVLATPTYTLLNDTLQEQLNDIYYTMKSYNGQTNISQVNDDLAFNISSSAIEDIIG